MVRIVKKGGLKILPREEGAGRRSCWPSSGWRAWRRRNQWRACRPAPSRPARPTARQRLSGTRPPWTGGSPRARTPSPPSTWAASSGSWCPAAAPPPLPPPPPPSLLLSHIFSDAPGDQILQLFYSFPNLRPPGDCEAPAMATAKLTFDEYGRPTCRRHRFLWRVIGLFPSLTIITGRFVAVLFYFFLRYHLICFFFKN